MNWITVEVFDGGYSAASWATAWHDRLIETAVTGGAVFWDEHEHRWGVVLEFVFADERQRDAFRQAPRPAGRPRRRARGRRGLPAPRWRCGQPA